MGIGGNMRNRGIRPIQVLPLGYLVIIMAGTLLLMLPCASVGERTGFFDALFTATSASCVTGLVVRDTGTQFTPFGQAVILLLIQTGGLGFMTLATLLFGAAGRRVSLFSRMTAAESLGADGLEGISSICARAARYTLVSESVGALLLYIRFARDFGPLRGIWYAVFHSVSAFCNAGFDLIGGYRSFVPYASDPLVCIVLALLVIAGGIGFAVIAEVIHPSRRGPAGISLHARLTLTVTAILLGLGAVLTLALEWDNPATLGAMDAGDRILASFFQSVTLRTAGFNTIDQAAMRDVTKFISSVFMFIGGASAGTAGGIKVTTVAVLMLTVRSFLKNDEDVTACGRRIAPAASRRAFSLFFSALAALLLCAVAVCASMEGRADFTDCLYECASALGTVGLTCGVTAAATPFARSVLCLLMFIGRAGILTLALAIGRGSAAPPVRYPEGGVMIG